MDLKFVKERRVDLGWWAGRDLVFETLTQAASGVDRNFPISRVDVTRDAHQAIVTITSWDVSTECKAEDIKQVAEKFADFAAKAFDGLEKIAKKWSRDYYRVERIVEDIKSRQKAGEQTPF